ncbi:hypothetical protein D039_1677, partial [Vibrio parahaemolyticus EKP-028]
MSWKIKPSPFEA